jgi:hypothetical protein
VVVVVEPSVGGVVARVVVVVRCRGAVVCGGRLPGGRRAVGGVRPGVWPSGETPTDAVDDDGRTVFGPDTPGPVVADPFGRWVDGRVLGAFPDVT